MLPQFETPAYQAAGEDGVGDVTGGDGGDGTGVVWDRSAWSMHDEVGEGCVLFEGGEDGGDWAVGAVAFGGGVC